MLAMLAVEKVEGPLDVASSTSLGKRGVEVLPMPIECVDERINSGALRRASRDNRRFTVRVLPATNSGCMCGPKSDV